MIFLRAYPCSTNYPSLSNFCRHSLTIYRSTFTTHRHLNVQKTYYEILGVNPSCSQKEIRAAYLELCKQYHPDKLQAEASSRHDDNARFQKINEAYNCLSKETERSWYDYDLSTGQTGRSSSPWSYRPRYPHHYASPRQYQQYYQNFTRMHYGYKYKQPNGGNVSDFDLFGKSITTFVICSLIVVIILQTYSQMLDFEMRKINTERRFEAMSRMYNQYASDFLLLAASNTDVRLG